MDWIILVIAFFMMAGVAVLFCNLLGLNPAEGMVLSVFLIIISNAAAIALSGSYMLAPLIIGVLALCGLASTVRRWIKAGKVGFAFLLSPYFIALTCVFLTSIFLYRGDLIQNVDELSLWALADKYMCLHDRFYIYEGYEYIQGSSLFRYFFLRMAEFTEGSLYTVSTLLYWIGLLLPFGKVKGDKWPRILLYILLMHIGLYSMYYYGSKSCAPELALACWTGGLAGWWITREKKKLDFLVLAIGLVTAFTFTSSVDAALVFFVLLLALLQMGETFVTKMQSSGAHSKKAIEVKANNAQKDFKVQKVQGENEAQNPEDETNSGRLLGLGYSPDFFLIIGSAVLFIFVTLIYSLATRFSYMEENLVLFLRCLVEKNMSLGRSDLNFTFIFSIVLAPVLLVAGVNRQYQLQKAVQYSIYSIFISAIYIAVLIFTIMNNEIITKEEYIIFTQRMISILVIYFFIMALSWMFLEKTIITRRVSYITGAVLLVIFMYGVNRNYLTYTTAAYPEKLKSYAEIQRVIRESSYIKKKIPSDKKVYLISQGNWIVPAEARFQLFDQVSDYTSQSWRYSVNGGMIGNEIAPYDGISTLPEALTEGKYSYVWIHSSDAYLNQNLPMIMGNSEELEKGTKEEDRTEGVSGKKEETSQKSKENEKVSEDSLKKKEATKNEKRLINQDDLQGGQLYKVLRLNGKAQKLMLQCNIVPYDNRMTYYRWKNLIKD